MNDDKKGYKEWMHEALKSRSEINDLNEEIQEQQVLLEHQDKIIRELREQASHFSEVVSVSEPSCKTCKHGGYAKYKQPCEVCSMSYLNFYEAQK